MEKKITNEPEVVFNVLSDKRVFGVKSEETDEVMFEISGYDLQFRFNRDKTTSLEEVEGLLEGIKDLFRKLILGDLLGNDETINSSGNSQ